MSPDADTVRPEGRGRAGKEGACADDREPGRCLSIPHKGASLRGGSLKLCERRGRAVKASVRMSAGEMAGPRSHEGSWAWDSGRGALALWVRPCPAKGP